MRRLRPLAAAMLLTSSATVVGAQGGASPSLGIRVGSSGETRSGTFTGVDLVGTLPLPWRIGRPESWSVEAKVEGTVGVLSGSGDHGIVGSAGPSVAIRKGGFPLYADGGTAAALITHHRYGSKNLGSWIQFISHISFLLQLGSVHAGYRLQHMSNASISEHNPGVNLHMIELRYGFR
jgi:hypothetical protein